MRTLLILLPCGCLLALLSTGCGRKPSTEFDDRPPIPTAPPAAPPAADPAVGTGAHTPTDPRPGEDLLAPRTGAGAGDASSSPARGPSTTYTYVPVPSPRELPGEKVPTTSPPTPPPSRQTFELRDLPPGTPVTVPPLPTSGPPGGIRHPSSTTVELKP